MEDHTLGYFSDVNFTYADEEERPRTLDAMILVGVLPVEVIIGILANIWAFAVIIKRRLWLQDEGYVYLSAILVTNALILAVQHVSIWFWCLNRSYVITRKADFLCKAFHFFFYGFYCTGLLVLALLFNVCLRSRRAKKEEEVQAPEFRSSICALIVALTLIIFALLMNIPQLVSFELQEHDGRVRPNEYYCYFADLWHNWFVSVTLIVALFIHGLPIVFVLPVLFALIACSGCTRTGCTCTGCKYGTNSREHFPRGTLLSLAGFIYFLQFPATVGQLFGGSLISIFNYSYMFIPIMTVVTILANGLVFTAVPILCIATMPKLREATFKAGCCSCGRSRKLEIEAIALKDAGQEN